MQTDKTMELIYNGNVGSGQIILNPEEEVDPTLLWAVWRIIAKSYIDPEAVDAQQMIYGAAQGIASSIDDPYTVFMTPSQHDDFRSALGGKLEGIGAELTLRDGSVIVVAPLKGSPAIRGGLLTEDVITEVDGENIEGETLYDVVHRIRGPKGTEVTIGVRREGEEDLVYLTFVRDTIKVPSTEYEIKETGSGSVGYIAINQFGERTNA